MAFGKWLSLILIPVLFGCKAVSTTTGVREPDLTFLQHAERRVQVEKVLGRREWTPGSADGLTYEIYQFRAAQPSRPVLGAVILAVDALSFGSMEIGLRDANDFKQLAIRGGGTRISPLTGCRRPTPNCGVEQARSAAGPT